MELQFARDSSVTLPKSDPLFKIMVILPNKKRRDKTANEFGEALKVFLGKKDQGKSLEYSCFLDSLDKISQLVNPRTE